jgi:hypothetical protein
MTFTHRFSTDRYLIITIWFSFIVQGQAASLLRQEKNTTCPQDPSNPCTAHNGNCSTCLAISGCGYCNDWRQCLPGDASGPVVSLHCECSVWIKVPYQCQEGLCAEKGGCAECTRRTYCVWCDNLHRCISGGLFGPNGNAEIAASQCSEWRWMHCGGLSGPHVLLVIGCVLVGCIIFVVITSCMIRCILRKRRKNTKFPPRLEEVPQRHQSLNTLSEDIASERTSLLRHSTD